MTEKHTRYNSMGRLGAAVLLPVAMIMAITSASMCLQAQAPAAAQRPNYQNPGVNFGAGPQLQLPPIPAAAPITPNGSVVEDVIARVNDQIITRSEYERAQEQLLQEAQQTNEAPDVLADRQKNLLRDMIDQQILLSKGKELGINGDAEMTRRLDDIRKQNHLDSMEALQKAAESQGVSFEDFKEGIKNSAITQQVVRDEVGRRINLTRTQEQAYYDAHGKEFEVPEQIHLSEILIPTADGATDAQVADAQSKADALEAKLKAGANFADLAKSSSGGPTASTGGDLGDFKHGTLGDVLEKATFPLQAGQFTAPIRTRQGFVILRVDSHQAAGVPPLDTIEPQIQEAVYMDALQPALRVYLTKSRDDLYIDIKPGFVDTGAAHKSAGQVFTAYAPPPPKKKVVAHQKAEQQKAEVAQAQLAAAREKEAEKNAARAAAASAKNAGKKNASMTVKPPKVRREKIRYGQAPRNSLPSAPLQTSTVNDGALAGQAPGVAMALTESTSTISTGEEATNEDPLAPKSGPTRKTRYAQREKEENIQHDESKLKKAEVKATIRPVAADTQTTATEKAQAAPLGLGGDTVKKPKKAKRQKGDPKERLQEKPKTTDTQTVAPTVNPALGTTPAGVTPAPAATDTTPSK